MGYKFTSGTLNINIFINHMADVFLPFLICRWGDIGYKSEQYLAQCSICSQEKEKLDTPKHVVNTFH